MGKFFIISKHQTDSEIEYYSAWKGPKNPLFLFAKTLCW